MDLVVTKAEYHITPGGAQALPASLRNVSRPYFVRLLDDDRLPYHRVGARRQALDAWSTLDQKFGLS